MEEEIAQVPRDPENIYRRDIAQLRSLEAFSEGEREALLEEARQGNTAAREVLLCSLLSVIVRYAERMKSHRAGTDFFALISVGNGTLVERFAVALDRPNPLAYLLKAAHGQMRVLYHLRADDAMMLPYRTEKLQPYQFISMNYVDHAPEFDLLPAEQRPAVGRDYAPLYQALNDLSPEYQMDVRRSFGLEYEEHLSPVPGVSLTKAEHRRVLVTLWRILLQKAPDFVQRHCRKAALDTLQVFDVEEAAAYLGMVPTTIRVYGSQGKLTPRTIGDRIGFAREDLDAYRRERAELKQATEAHQTHQLRKALQQLQIEQQPITLRSLRARSHVSYQATATFLSQWKTQQIPDNPSSDHRPHWHAPKTSYSAAQHRRLEQALHRLLQERATITTRSLAVAARVNYRATAAFLQEQEIHQISVASEEG